MLPRGPVVDVQPGQDGRPGLHRPRVQPEQPLAGRFRVADDDVLPGEDLAAEVMLHGGVFEALASPLVRDHLVKVLLDLGQGLAVVEVAFCGRDVVVKVLEHGLSLVDGLDVLLVVVRGHHSRGRRRLPVERRLDRLVFGRWRGRGDGTLSEPLGHGAESVCVAGDGRSPGPAPGPGHLVRQGLDRRRSS